MTGHQQGERRGGDRAHDEQRPEHLLGGVGDGGEVVGREDGERGGLPEALVDRGAPSAAPGRAGRRFTP